MAAPSASFAGASPAPHTSSEPDARTWRARLSLTFEKRRGRTALVHKSHHGPLMVQSPFYPGDGACHLYLLHPPGGLVGGDHLETTVRAGRDTRTLVTTPAATKFYRSNGQSARQRQTVEVGEDACFEWVPQEGLVFDGAEAVSETAVHLSSSSRLLAWESWCLGRPASGDDFLAGSLDQRLEVTVDGRPKLIERLELGDDLEALRAPWGHGGHAAWSTALAYPADEAILEAVRTLADETLADDTLVDDASGGAPDRIRTPRIQLSATLLDGLLVVRAQARRTRELIAWLHRLWRTLRPAVLGLVPDPPRIWAT